MPDDPTPKFEDVMRTAVTEPVRFSCAVDNFKLAFQPPVDVKETAAEWVVYIDLPGVDEDELRFCWGDQELCICGSRDINHDTEDAEVFTRLERSFGEFRCKIPLDHTVDANRATAKYRRGVLKITLPRFKSHEKGHRSSKARQIPQAVSAIRDLGHVTADRLESYPQSQEPLRNSAAEA